MSDSTKTKHGELLSTQNNVEEIPNNGSSRRTGVEHVEGTPFKLVTVEEGSFLAIGTYRLHEPRETKEEALKYMDENKWDLILHMILILDETKKEIENQIFKTNKIQQL